MKKSKLRFIFLAVITLVITTTNAQISSTTIDSLVEEAMEKFDVAGVSVAIVKDGKIIHSKGYGVKSLDTKEKVDEHYTVCHCF